MTNDFSQRLASKIFKISDAVGWTGVQYVRLGDGTIPGKVIVLDDAKERPGNMWAYDPHDKTRGPFQVSNQFAGLAYDDSQAHIPIWIGYPPKSKVLSIGGLDPNIGHVFTGGALPSQSGIINAAMTTPDRFLSMRLTVTSTPLMLAISGGWWRKENRLVWTPSNQTFLDLTSYLPADDGDAKYLLVGINVNNAPVVIEGDPFLSTLTEVAAFIPTEMTEGVLIVALVLVIGNDTTITQSRIIPIPDIYSVWAYETVLVSDAEFTIFDNVDPTKKGQFQLAGLTTATTRTWTMPNRNTGFVILSPGASTDNVIQPTGDFRNLVLKQFAGQTQPHLQIEDDAGNVLTTFGPETGDGGTFQVNYSVGAISYLRFTIANASPNLVMNRFSTSQDNQIVFATNTVNKWFIGQYAAEISDDLFIGYSSLKTVRFGQTSEENVLTIDSSGNVGIGLFTPSSQLDVLANGGATTTAAEVLRIKQSSSSTPAAGFGAVFRVDAHSSTNTYRSLFDLTSTWATATDASRKAQVVFNVWDTDARAAITLAATGSIATVQLSNTTIISQAAATEATVIRGAASQSANLLTLQDSALSGVFGISPSGRTRVGSSTAPTIDWLLINQNTAVTSGSDNGIRSVFNSNPAASTSAALIAISAQMSIASGNAQNHTDALSAISGTFSHGGTGTLNRAEGLRIVLSASSTGTITTAYGIRIIAPINSGGGTISTAVGIEIGDHTVGGTNIALRTNAGQVIFNEGGNANTDVRVEGDTDVNLLFTDASADAVGIGTNAPVAKLHVTQPTLGNEVHRLESTATNDDPRESVYQNRAATTDATVTTLHTFTVPASTTYMIEAHVTARRTGGAAGTAEDGAGYVIRGTYKNVAGTATLVGAVNADYTAEDQAAWDATFDVTGATVRCRVTGAVNNNITWHMTARVYQVGS